MLKIRRLLCPSDFSPSSTRALDEVIPLARWYDAELAVLHVVPFVPAVGDVPPYIHPISLEPIGEADLKRELRRWAEPAFAAGVATQVVIRRGEAAPVILDFARAFRADMVVMGTHGRRGFEHWALGSVAEKVLREAACPVLTASLAATEVPKATEPPFRRILCAVDFSAPSLHGLDHALAIALEAGSHVILLHCLEWAPEDVPPHHLPSDVDGLQRFLESRARTQLRERIPEEARNWCAIEEVVVKGRPHEEILRLARERESQLVVLGVHSRGKLDMALFGSTANHVVGQAPCPVLTVPLPPRHGAKLRHEEEPVSSMAP